MPDLCIPTKYPHITHHHYLSSNFKLSLFVLHTFRLRKKPQLILTIFYFFYFFYVYDEILTKFVEIIRINISYVLFKNKCLRCLKCLQIMLDIEIFLIYGGGR